MEKIQIEQFKLCADLNRSIFHVRRFSQRMTGISVCLRHSAAIFRRNEQEKIFDNP